MKGFWHSLFMPVQNRHYIDKRMHAMMYLAAYIPMLVTIIIGAIIEPSKAWLLLGLALTFFIILDYFIFDRMRDFILWRGFYRKHYEKDLHISEDHAVLKEYENNPSADNLNKLKNKLGE